MHIVVKKLSDHIKRTLKYGNISISILGLKHDTTDDGISPFKTGKAEGGERRQKSFYRFYNPSHD